MISIVIPTYKNRALLASNLKKNVKYFGKNEVIIVNDDPRTSIKSDLNDLKDIILIENGQNLGFAGAVNRGVRAATYDYVMILNSDVVLQDDSYEKTVQNFQRNKKLFAVSFAQIEKDGTTVGRNAISWKHGFVQHSGVPEIKSTINAWAEGGSMIVDKTKFDRLHGFSTLYYPFYWEDVDLSYRAWKAGYEVLFDPHIEVIHHHESTIGKYFEKDRVSTIAYRNQFIFMWKNITDTALFSSHLASLPKRVLGALVRADIQFLGGFAGAFIKIPGILKQRKENRRLTVMKDREVFALFNETT